MNAPREYYPMGYDKNFDDNFASRVDLPDTSFYCGDQKHFPGLYADEDLGCMVNLFLLNLYNINGDLFIFLFLIVSFFVNN